MVAKVLGKTGAPIKSCAMMYKVVFHAVLLYGSEIWVVTDAMMMVLEGFPHSTARHIAGMTVDKGEGRECECSSVDKALETTGNWMIREYMRRR